MYVTGWYSVPNFEVTVYYLRCVWCEGTQCFWERPHINHSATLIQNRHWNTCRRLH